MKLTSLLTQYLYTNHRLDLPGIGSFVLDPSSISSVENSKQRSTVLDGISFEHNPSVKTSPELITYISSQSGKMKALASADLESHIQLVQQFLNLGKPFTFEGIGTLVKKKNNLEFSALSVPTEKVKELQAKEATPVTLEESSAQYESFLGSPKMNFSWRRPVMALLVLAGIALAIWGGYTISKKAATNDQTVIPETVQQPITQPDTTLLVKNDPPKPKDYKYILQVSKKQTAMRRYNQLLTNRWDVKMETNDSVNFKLYMLFPANSDTTHVLDSLTVMTGKKVYIEPQN